MKLSYDELLAAAITARSTMTEFLAFHPTRWNINTMAVETIEDAADKEAYEARLKLATMAQKKFYALATPEAIIEVCKAALAQQASLTVSSSVEAEIVMAAGDDDAAFAEAIRPAYRRALAQQAQPRCGCGNECREEELIRCDDATCPREWCCPTCPGPQQALPVSLGGKAHPSESKGAFAGREYQQAQPEVPDSEYDTIFANRPRMLETMAKLVLQVADADELAEQEARIADNLLRLAAFRFAKATLGLCVDCRARLLVFRTPHPTGLCDACLAIDAHPAREHQ